jgi:hypothetical protein
MGSSHDTIIGFIKIGAAIYDHCPGSIRPMLPLADPHFVDHRSRSVIHIAKELMRISPLITGSFPSIFSESTNPKHQVLASYGGFSSLRLRDITLSDIQDENLVILLRTIMQMLLDRSYPVWTFYFLEDIHTPIVQEIIRYLPTMVHLRASPSYGGLQESPPLIPLDGNLDRIDPQHINELNDDRRSIINDLTIFENPTSLTWDQRLAVRNFWYPGAEITSDIPRRPDLTPFQLPMGADHWAVPLNTFMQRMMHLHDPGRYPLAIVIKHLLDQFYDPHAGEIVASSRGVNAEVRYDSFQRPA